MAADLSSMGWKVELSGKFCVIIAEIMQKMSGDQVAEVKREISEGKTVDCY